ncbi:hypothetical protein BWK69_00265 [Candidatus Parcubacteria bacterium A4]|nr:MAG: hypothetical protein BWK69_00265 [Candidatus Parcubacteria bacterium A4]
MRFTVPQFIEYESKIVGPLTFKQFFFVGSAIAICFAVRFAFPAISFLNFIMICLVVGGGGAALAFLKINGKTLPAVLINFLNFNISTKKYLWQKKDAPIMMVKEIKKEKNEARDKPILRISDKSRLKNLYNRLETSNEKHV